MSSNKQPEHPPERTPKKNKGLGGKNTKAWALVLGTLFFLLGIVLVNNQYKNKGFSELWLIDAPIIKSPFEVSPSERYKGAMEVQKVLDAYARDKKPAQKLFVIPPTPELSYSRKFNSSILYLTSRSPENLDEAYQWVAKKTKINFSRVLLKDQTKEISSEKNRALLAITFIYLTFLFGISVSKNRNPEGDPKIAHQKTSLLVTPSFLGVIVVLCLGINWLNKETIGKTHEIETKVQNNFVPYSKNYAHKFASSTLKSMVGEVSYKILKDEGYPSGFRMVVENELFEKDHKRNKGDTLWLSSTAKGKRIAQVKVKAESIVKEFLKTTQGADSSSITKLKETTEGGGTSQ